MLEYKDTRTGQTCELGAGSIADVHASRTRISQYLEPKFLQAAVVLAGDWPYLPWLVNAVRRVG